MGENSEANSNTNNKENSTKEKSFSGKKKVASFVATAGTTSTHVFKNTRNSLKKAMSKKKVDAVVEEPAKNKDNKKVEDKKDAYDEKKDPVKSKDEENPVVDSN